MGAGVPEVPFYWVETPEAETGGGWFGELPLTDAERSRGPASGSHLARGGPLP
jgi:hypothetical protein